MIAQNLSAGFVQLTRGSMATSFGRHDEFVDAHAGIVDAHGRD
jgi:hypothetical protein